MPGLTPEGWVPKTLEQILASIEERQRAAFGADVDTSEFSVIGQNNRIFADELAQLWELGEDLYDMLDPDKVTGAQQDALYSLTNTLRLPASKSRVVATVNLDGSTSIAAGDAVASVEGNPTARFVNIEAMVNAGGSPADVDVVFEAEQTGPVLANADTLTVQETTPLGWNSITNDDDADPVGRNAESNAEYRIRRLVELAAPGSASLIGLSADLNRVEGVTAVQVLENIDSITNADGMPPHSIEAVVLGGADEAIADNLLKNKAGGIKAHGSTVVVVEDDEGVEHSIGFSRPTSRNVWVAIEVVTGDGYDEAALKQAIADSSQLKLEANGLPNPSFLDVGDEVYSGRIVCDAVEVAGVLNARVGLSFASIATPDDGDSVLTIAAREIAVLAVARIAVTIV